MNGSTCLASATTWWRESVTSAKGPLTSRFTSSGLPRGIGRMSRTLAVPPRAWAIVPHANPPLALVGGPLRRASRCSVLVVVFIPIANSCSSDRLIPGTGQPGMAESGQVDGAGTRRSGEGCGATTMLDIEHPLSRIRV